MENFLGWAKDSEPNSLDLEILPMLGRPEEYCSQLLLLADSSDGPDGPELVSWCSGELSSRDKHLSPARRRGYI